MWNHLGIWSKKYAITHGAMNELKISKCEGHRLPKDSRTIRKTPSAVTISEICCRHYVYLGIQNGVILSFKKSSDDF